jgi:hypothetical protein
LTISSSTVTAGTGVTTMANTFKLSTATGMYLNSSGYSAAGHGDSYHISGTGATEVRGLVISPLDVETDLGTCALVVDHGGSGSAIADPIPADANRRFALGCRPEQSSMQIYVRCGPVPEGWKAVSVIAYVSDRSDGSQMNVRIAVASRKIKNISQGSSASDYFTSHLALSNSHTSNAERPFSSSFTQTSATPRNLYLYIATQSANATFTGGRIRIERV